LASSCLRIRTLPQNRCDATAKQNFFPHVLTATQSHGLACLHTTVRLPERLYIYFSLRAFPICLQSRGPNATLCYCPIHSRILPRTSFVRPVLQRSACMYALVSIYLRVIAKI